jgi:hypothetical protein
VPYMTSRTRTAHNPYAPTEWVQTPIDEFMDFEPHPHAVVRDDRCPAGLVKGERVNVAAGVKFHGEQEIPVGTPVRFTRYAYDRFKYRTLPIYKYAMFRFPDGTERSLPNGSFTTLFERSPAVATSKPAPGRLCSFFDLVAAMKSRTRLTMLTGTTYRHVLINGIIAEDGSGLSWNVNVNHDNNASVAYWHEDGHVGVRFFMP